MVCLLVPSTSTANDVPELPIAVTLPATDFVAGSDCCPLSDCKLTGSARACTPTSNRPMRGTLYRIFCFIKMNLRDRDGGGRGRYAKARHCPHRQKIRVNSLTLSGISRLRLQLQSRAQRGHLCDVNFLLGPRHSCVVRRWALEHCNAQHRESEFARS